jgi:Leucine-rich repeat (LRR) protein
MSVEILSTLYDINTEILDLKDKNISEIPESIGELVNLKSLVLEKNLLNTTKINWQTLQFTIFKFS